MRISNSFPPLLVCATLAFGCKKKSDETVAPAPAPAAATEQTAEAPTKDPDKAGVSIDPKIAAMCDLDSTNFDFDSTRLSGGARGVLDALATCFKDGPAAGKSMRLVGHADPRGDEEYNMGLGQRRAGSVSKYLKKRGLDGSRVETSSRGELDANGTDDASWARDRKVEIFLAE